MSDLPRSSDMRAFFKFRNFATYAPFVTINVPQFPFKIQKRPCRKLSIVPEASSTSKSLNCFFLLNRVINTQKVK